MCRYYVLKAVTKYAQQKAAKGTITGEEQRDTISSEGSDVSISTMYDMLMYIGPENGAASQSWCGADATQAQKGALSSKERRKRKRMEVGQFFTESCLDTLCVCEIASNYAQPLC